MATSQRPRVLFFGGGGGTARVLLVDSGVTDAGATYSFKARSNPLTPATPSGEIAVFATYLVFTALDTDVPLNIDVRLYVNLETVPLTRTIVIPVSVGQQRYSFHVSWHESVLDGSTERVTVAPRGNMMVLELESSGTIPAGRIVIDGVETEIQITGGTLVSEAV